MSLHSINRKSSVRAGRPCAVLTAALPIKSRSCGKREKKPSGQHSGDVRRTGNRAVAISSTVTAISRQVEVRKSTEGSERWWDLPVSRVPFLMALRPAVDVQQPDLSVCVKGCAVLPSVRRPPHLSFPGKISEMMNGPCQILSSLRSTAAYLISARRPLERFKMVGTNEASGLSGRLKCGRSPPDAQSDDNTANAACFTFYVTANGPLGEEWGLHKQ